MRFFYKLLSIIGDFKAASRGPDKLFKRYVRKSAHKSLAKALRSLLR